MSKNCESCGMPISNGKYCQHCVDEKGNLQTFKERVMRLSLFLKKNNPVLSQVEAEQQAKAYMSSMPAWKNHPEIQ